MKRSKTLGILWHSRFFCLIFDLSASFDIKMRQINSFLGIYYQDRHLRLLPRHQYQHHRTNIKRNAGCWRNPKSRERKRYRIYCQIKDPVIIYRPHFRFICLIWCQNEADKFIFGADNWENYRNFLFFFDTTFPNNHYLCNRNPCWKPTIGLRWGYIYINKGVTDALVLTG